MTVASDQWEQRGERIPLAGYEVFVVDIGAGDSGDEAEQEPLLIIHGFPTSSFDFHQIADPLARDRRVVLFDMVGYGLSDKPDIAYTVDIQAEVAVALTERLGLDRISLLTHDFGDTVGGELLARQQQAVGRGDRPPGAHQRQHLHPHGPSERRQISGRACPSARRCRTDGPRDPGRQAASICSPSLTVS